MENILAEALPALENLQELCGAALYAKSPAELTAHVASIRANMDSLMATADAFEAAHRRTIEAQAR